MKTTEMIKKFDIRLGNKDGDDTMRIYNRNTTSEELEMLKTNKPGIIAELKAVKIEAEEKRAATITFWAVGWEAHEISIDTRKDVIAQLENYVNNDDLTLETLKKAYEKHIGGIVDSEAAEIAEQVRVKDIKEVAKITGVRQEIKSYMAECNLPDEECNTDLITIYAMPDGTETEVRQHTY